MPASKRPPSGGIRRRAGNTAGESRGNDEPGVMLLELTPQEVGTRVLEDAKGFTHGL